MQERILQLLKGTQFFDLGTVIFASNHPNHVYLVEVQNDDNEIFTVLFDRKNNYLNINKRVESNENEEDAEEPMYDIMNNITAKKQQEIKQLLIESGNDHANNDNN